MYTVKDMTEPQFSSETKNELNILHHRFEAKKNENTPDQSEKDIFRNVFRERFNELRQSIQSVPPPAKMPPAIKNSTTIKNDDTNKDREEKLQSLIEAAFSGGPGMAIDSAQKLGDYYLDELHDRLADEYYEKLIQFQKLKNIS